MEQNDYGADLITLIDEEGVEHEFEVIDCLEDDNRMFYALFPITDDLEDVLEQSTYYIFEAIEGEDGEQEMAEVEDDELLDKLADMFEKRFDEMFDEVDETEE